MVFRPIALILDIDFVKNILIKDFNNFRDRGMFHNAQDDPLTGNLFQIDGPKWRELRQKLTPTFSAGKIKYMYPFITKVADELVQVMREKQAADVDGIVEITDLVSSYTADVIGSCAFGIECNSLRNPNAKFVTIGQKALTKRRHTTFVDTLIIEGAPKLARALHMRQLAQEVHDFYLGLVHDTVTYREKNNVTRKDLLQLLIELKNKDRKEGGLTMNEIAAQAYAFLVAGFESPSATMAFALYELAKHQDIQERLRSEIHEVLERNNNEFNFEALHDMRYLDQVVMEALRKYPVLGHLTREAKADYQTNYPRYIIEKGTVITIPVSAINYDPEYYPNREQFDPERFTEAEIKKRPACTWLPFGDGPRNCIGYGFDKIEVFVGLTYLLRYFRFSACKDTEEKPLFRKDKILL